MPTRLCGATRVAGGIYWEFGRWIAIQSVNPETRSLVRDERLQMLVLDPPVEIDVAAIGLTAIDVKMIERNGVYHILDWVGENHYPNVADFVEEAIAIGVSRRIPSTINLSLLSAASRLLLVHKRAWIGHRVGMPEARPDCPTRNDTHEPPYSTGMTEMCVRRWWHDILGGTRVVPGRHEVMRALPCGHSYEGIEIDGVPRMRRPAIFAALPLDRLAVVRDTHGRWSTSTERVLEQQGVRFMRVSE
jgi:hypothetical protein